MQKITLELHADLADWLRTTAEKRNLNVDQTVLQLLEEERMQDLFIQRVEVPICGERWNASISMRGLIYSGYQTSWQKVEAGPSTETSSN